MTVCILGTLFHLNLQSKFVTLIIFTQLHCLVSIHLPLLVTDFLLMTHRWLQDVFDVPLVIMLTDDEKYIFGEKREIEEVRGYSWDNAKDIIAVGFDPKKTFIFSDYDFMGGAFYRNVTRISKKVTLNVARAVFGFDDRYGWRQHIPCSLLTNSVHVLARSISELSKAQPHSHPHSLIYSEKTKTKPPRSHQ